MEQITIKEASERMGVSQATLRSWIKHKAVPFGIADCKDGCQRTSFVIFRKDFEEYVLSKS